MKTLRRITNKKLELLEQRLEFKRAHDEIPSRRYKGMIVMLAREHLRRAGVDVDKPVKAGSNL